MLPADALCRSFDSLLLDLDGVVYVGDRAVPHAVDTLNLVRTSGISVSYVTNNASRTPQTVAEQLSAMGLAVTADDVITSAQAGAGLIADQVAPGSTVLAVGGPGVAAALRERGLVPIDAIHDEMSAAGDDVAAVLQGFGRELGWTALARSAFAVATGVPWVATNVDMTIPVRGGTAPGNGTLVAAVATATGRKPEVAGKPYPPILLRAGQQSGGSRPLVVGDRLDTDIEGATNAGMSSFLVLTGVTRALDLWRAIPRRRPQFMAADLSGLVEPRLTFTTHAGIVACRAATATLDGAELVVSAASDPAAGIWAAAQLLWTCDREPANAADVAAGLDRGLRDLLAS